MAKRRRGVCLVEMHTEDHGVVILMAKQKGDKYDMLPGGRVEPKEAPIIAAIRELREETTLKTLAAVQLFDYASPYTLHHVFLIKAEGDQFEPRDDVERLWLLPLSECLDQDRYPTLSRSTREILTRYLTWREGRDSAFPLMDPS